MLHIAQAIVHYPVIQDVRIIMVTSNMFDVLGIEVCSYTCMTLVGACRIIHQEHPWISCLHIDFDNMHESLSSMTAKILYVLDSKENHAVIAYRGSKCWYPTYQNLHVEKAQKNNCLRPNGVYIIAGGLGKMGMLFTEYLIENGASEIYLLTRRTFPPQSEWAANINLYDKKTAQLCRKLLKFMSRGAAIYVFSGDLLDVNSLEKMKQQIVDSGKTVTGIIHAAGLTDEQSTVSITETTESDCKTQFAPRVDGLQNLERVFHDLGLEFIYLNSSLSVHLGGLGLYAYAAAHSFLGQYCIKRRKETSVDYLCVNWDRIDEESAITPKEFKTLLPYTFHYMSKIPLLIVSKENLFDRIERIEKNDTRKATAAQDNTVPKQEISSIFSTVDYLKFIWTELLGEEIIQETDNFFDLGGHSLLAIQMIERIKERYQINLPIRYVFDHPTVCEIAEYIDTFNQ